jgi:ribosomal-protein-alanine N-acetyltransferase
VTIRLRFMGRDDIEQIAALEQRIFSDPWSPEAFAVEETRDPSRWARVVAVAETNEVAAYLIAWFVADEVHLGNVAVAPEHRRQGLAQQLMDELIEAGRRRGARLVTLEVRRSNRSAQDLYRKNGFYTVMIRRGYYQDREDALVMIKPLNDFGRIPPLEEPA